MPLPEESVSNIVLAGRHLTHPCCGRARRFVLLVSRHPLNGEFAPADALDKLDTLTAPWKCATLKGTLGRFVDGKVPRGPHNFLAYQGRRMRRRRGRG